MSYESRGNGQTEGGSKLSTSATSTLKDAPINVLFICSQNLYRSPTAEAVFSSIPGLEVSSAGTREDAETPISSDLIEWADTLFVVEPAHRRRLQSRCGSQLRTKRLIVLGIPDLYTYMDPALITLLKQRVTPHLRLTPTNILGAP